jgi:hypothetical protein
MGALARGLAPTSYTTTGGTTICVAVGYWFDRIYVFDDPIPLSRHVLD